MEFSPLLVLVLALILWAEFINGWTDAPNAIATVVSTRVLTSKKAVILASLLNLLGALSGTAVATTIGRDIVKPEFINLLTLLAAMVGIIFWSTLAWKYGLPTSESHALISGLAGSALAAAGPEALIATGWHKVLVGLLFSTFLGFVGAYILFTLIMVVFRKMSISKVRRYFGKAQIFSASFMAFSHGSNDGQKFMGAFALALLLSGVTKEFSIPVWVIVMCAVIMGIGTSCGGWRIIRTMGGRLTKLEPQHGFAAETAAAAVIELASRTGIPLSTTHTINTSIIGVSSAQRLGRVHWGVARSIVIAWILTFPVCGLISFGLTKILLFVVK